MSDQQVLLAVQDLDTAIVQHEVRKASLPERRRLDELDGRLDVLGARTEQLEAERSSLAARQAELEEQVASLSARRQTVEDRLYGARGSAARDLQAMDEEVRHLTQRRSEVEDAELEIMEALEPIDAQLASAAEERQVLKREHEAARSALVEGEATVDQEIAELAARRRQEASRLPTALLDRYETLRGRLAGVGAARLVGNRCEGCHLELPAVEVDRIRHLPADEIVTCDQCGRILVRDEGADPHPPR